MQSDKSLDKKFRECSNLRYYPWVGTNYQKQETKILIVGESHYYGETCSLEDSKTIDENNEFTRECFCNVEIPVYQKMEAMLANNLLEFDWVRDCICFYNFFQKCVGYGAADKSCINEELINVSRKAFFEVINILTPDIIIVWGKTDMWTWMPPFDFEEGKMYSKNLYIYNKYKNSIIFHIEHPSSRTFDIIKTTNFIKEQFEEIGKTLTFKQINIPIQK